MYWANFLHIYQPPTQKRYILEKIVSESYRPLLQALVDTPKAKITLNISGVLTQMLDREGYGELLDQLRLLSARGQVELTASAKYHPFLPLLPEHEIIRQIEQNDLTNRKLLGEGYRPEGFFIPELTYTPVIGELIKSLGYKWTIIDQTSLPVDYDSTKLYQSGNGLTLFVRHHEATLALLRSTKADEFKKRYLTKSTASYLITASDGEIYGHHQKNHLLLIQELWQQTASQTVTLSELADHFPDRETIAPITSSWDHLDQHGTPIFNRWKDPTNAIHGFQHELMSLAIAVVKKAGSAERDEARQALDEGLHSCQLWWASATPWWSLEMIEQGAYKLLSAIMTAKKATKKERDQAQELYYKIITTGFDWQRTGHLEERDKRRTKD